MAWSNMAKVGSRLWRLAVTNEDRKRDPELGHLARAARSREYTRDSSGRIIFARGALVDPNEYGRWSFVSRA